MTHYSSTIEHAKASRKNAFVVAQVSLISTLLFLVLLVLLHFIKPEIEPSWRFISEYAIGKNGWIMMFAFLSLGVGYATLFASIKSCLPRTFVGKTALFLLLVSAAGLILGGTFVTDPVTANENERTISGTLHSVGGALGMAMPFAAILIYVAIRKSANWSAFKRPILFATLIATVGFLFSFISLGVMLTESGGKFGPNVLVGWPNRIEIACYCIWLLAVATQVKRFKAQ